MKPTTTLQRSFGAAVVIVFALAAFGIARAWALLRPYPYLLYTQYAEPVGYLLAASVINLTCWLYLVWRYLLLKETGRKLVHFEKQLATGETAAEELARVFRQS